MPIIWTLRRLKQEDCKVGSSWLHSESLSQNTRNQEAGEMAVERFCTGLAIWEQQSHGPEGMACQEPQGPGPGVAGS